MDDELDNIKNRWEAKYHEVFITLWSSANGYFGNMLTTKECIDIKADTLANLIEKGEEFLRSMANK